MLKSLTRYIADNAPYAGLLAVIATDTPSMDISVAPGRAVTAAGSLCLTDAWGATLAPPTAHPRIDLVEGSTRSQMLTLRLGIESASPIAPAVTEGAIPLAHIYHRVGETCVKNSDDSVNAYTVDLRIAASLAFTTDGALPITLFAGFRPADAPILCTVVLERGFEPASEDEADKREKPVQFFTRGPSYFGARDEANRIFNFLINKTGVSIAGWWLHSVVGGAPQSIGQDSKGAHEFSTNLMIRARKEH